MYKYAILFLIYLACYAAHSAAIDWDISDNAMECDLSDAIMDTVYGLGKRVKPDIILNHQTPQEIFDSVWEEKGTKRLLSKFSWAQNKDDFTNNSFWQPELHFRDSNYQLAMLKLSHALNESCKPHYHFTSMHDIENVILKSPVVTSGLIALKIIADTTDIQFVWVRRKQLLFSVAEWPHFLAQKLAILTFPETIDETLHTLHVHGEAYVGLVSCIWHHDLGNHYVKIVSAHAIGSSFIKPITTEDGRTTHPLSIHVAHQVATQPLTDSEADLLQPYQHLFLPEVPIEMRGQLLFFLILHERCWAFPLKHCMVDSQDSELLNLFLKKYPSRHMLVRRMVDTVIQDILTPRAKRIERISSVEAQHQALQHWLTSQKFSKLKNKEFLNFDDFVYILHAMNEWSPNDITFIIKKFLKIEKQETFYLTCSLGNQGLLYVYRTGNAGCNFIHCLLPKRDAVAKAEKQGIFERSLFSSMAVMEHRDQIFFQNMCHFYKDQTRYKNRHLFQAEGIQGGTL